MAQYKVANAPAGNDSNNGLSELTPWETMAKVNGFSFAEGDQVDLNGDDTWREQLSIPRTGADGSPMAFDRYGTGADPKISAFDIISGFTSANNKLVSDGNTVALWDFDDDLTDASGNGRTLAETGSIPFSASGAPFDKYGTFDGANDLASYDDSEAGDGDAFDFGNATSFTVEGWFRYTVDHVGILCAKGSAGQVRINIYVLGGSIRAYGYNGATEFAVNGNDPVRDGEWHHFAAVYDWASEVDGKLTLWVDGVVDGTAVALSGAAFDNAPDFTIGGYTDGSYKFNGDIEQIRISDVARTSFPTATGANVWKATVTTEPTYVYFDDTFGTDAGSLAAVDAANDWFWDSNLLYVYSTSDPDTAYTSPGIEASQRAYAIFLNAKNWVDIDNIQVVGSNSATAGALQVYGDNLNFRNLTVTRGGRGVRIYLSNTVLVDSCTLDNAVHNINPLEGCANVTISNNNISGGNDESVVSEFVSGETYSCTNLVIIDNTFSNCGKNAIQLALNNGVTVEGNTIQDAGAYPTAFPIGIFLDGDNVGTLIVRGNWVDGVVLSTGTTGAAGIRTEADNTQLEYNLVTNCHGAGVTVYGASGVTVYNTTVFNCGTNAGVSGSSRAAFSIEASSDTVVGKNNISASPGEQHTQVDADSTTGLDFDFNCYQGDAGTLFTYAGSDYNFADWKINSSQDANSKNKDPLFVDAANDDFRLTAPSPCIKAGTNVGLKRDKDGVFVPTVPDIGAHQQLGIVSISSVSLSFPELTSVAVEF